MDLERLAATPEITPTLKTATGGLKAILSAMRLTSNDDTIAAFLRVYDSIPVRDRESVPWEAIALKADLDARALLGSAILALQFHSASKVKLIALSRHPDVIRARIAAALTPGGHRDRDSFDTALGFLPSPKPPTFIGKAVFAGSGAEAPPPRPSASDDDEETDLDNLFPSVTEMQERLAPVRRRMLEAGD